MKNPIRGYMWFCNRYMHKVKATNYDALVPGLKTKKAFFDNCIMRGHSFNEPGIFISGVVDAHIGSDYVVAEFRKKNLKDDILNCDVTIGAIDYLKQGDIKGNYIGIRIAPEYDDAKIKGVASDIAQILKAHDVLVRKVEKDKQQPYENICIDILTETVYKPFSQDISQVLHESNLAVVDYSFIEGLRPK